jgi:secondary thiamine-phosphate synthase enzyme
MVKSSVVSPIAIFMPHRQQLLQVKTSGKSLSNITRKVQEAVAQSGINIGLCSIFLRHTSASLIIQENADPDVLADLETFLAKLIPEGPYYRHSTEGPDDMPAHIRTALTHTSEQIPVNGGRLILGTWQGIYVWEHRQQGSVREVVIHVSGD